MSARDEFELIVASWFEASAPSVAPVAVHDQAMASVRNTHQHASWYAAVHTGLASGGKPTIRLIALQLAAIDRCAVVRDSGNASQSRLHPRRALAIPAGRGVFEHGRVHFRLGTVEIDKCPRHEAADHR